MLALTLAQMRRGAGRLVAAGVAVVIGTAFVAATFLAGNVLMQTMTQAIAAKDADADLVLTNEDGYTAEDLAAVRDAAGVASAYPVTEDYYDFTYAGRRSIVMILGTPSDPRLTPMRVAEGRFPSAGTEVALPVDVTQRLGVALGGTVTVKRPVTVTGTGNGANSQNGANNETYIEKTETLTVVGTLTDPHNAYAAQGGAALLPQATLLAWRAETDSWVYSDTGHANPRPGAITTVVLVALAPGTDRATARSTLVAASPAGALARTPSEHAQDIASRQTADQNVVQAMFLGFAGLALFVASLVIANTFQVLVAQRTRTLALLRAVGADKRQLSRSVLTEAAILGTVASVVGVGVGVLLVQLALMILGHAQPDMTLPGAISMTWPVVVVPIALGVATTVLAGLAPARAATRVSPLEAMRPADSPTITQRTGKVRVAFAAGMFAGGVALIGLGMIAGGNNNPRFGLLIAVAGVAISFFGFLIGAVFLVPRFVALVGRPLARVGPTTRLAVANTLRNPRRTAVTATALLLGVTLVSIMSTVAFSARETANKKLDTSLGIDVVVQEWYSDDSTGIPASLLEKLRGLDGVRELAQTRSAQVTLSATESNHFLIFGVNSATLAAVVHDPSDVAELADGMILVPVGTFGTDTVTLTGIDGPQRFTVKETTLPIAGPTITDADFDRLSRTGAVHVAYIALNDPEHPSDAVNAINDTVSDSGDGFGVTGSAIERASVSSMINTVFLVVGGLLAVAVLIALIGVANTLSLSVIERRRESATLRAIGLDRRRLRSMLAIEGTLIAGVGALLGLGLGLLYGWGVTKAGLATVGDVQLVIPWLPFAGLFGIALTAGLLASILPGRAAARTSPVAALAVE